jgi:hypothetical protein
MPADRRPTFRARASSPAEHAAQERIGAAKAAAICGYTPKTMRKLAGCGCG